MLVLNHVSHGLEAALLLFHHIQAHSAVSFIQQCPP